MRTTITLDEDVAIKLKGEARRSGRSFRETVNDTLRRGLATKSGGGRPQPFQAAVRDLGDLRPGVSLDNIGTLLEQLEGPLHR